MAQLRCHSVKMFYKISSRLWQQVSKAYSCSHTCRCLEIMQLLQEQLTSKPREYQIVGKFVTERMGWDDASTNDDLLHRWPFSFLLKKALKGTKHTIISRSSSQMFIVQILCSMAHLCFQQCNIVWKKCLSYKNNSVLNRKKKTL